MTDFLSLPDCSALNCILPPTSLLFLIAALLFDVLTLLEYKFNTLASNQTIINKSAINKDTVYTAYAKRILW